MAAKPPGAGRPLGEVGLQPYGDGSPCSDGELATRFLEGDGCAFEELVTRYARPIFNFVYRFVGDYDEANDLAQSVFIQLHTSLHTARLDLPLRPWIFRIARNKALDHLRRKRAIRFSELESDDEDGETLVERIADADPLPEEIYERADLQRVLAEAILALPEKYRLVVTLRYVNGLTFGEIGQALEIPENTAKTHFQRTKGLLRRRLAGQIEPDV